MRNLGGIGCVLAGLWAAGPVRAEAPVLWASEPPAGRDVAWLTVSLAAAAGDVPADLGASTPHDLARAHLVAFPVARGRLVALAELEGLLGQARRQLASLNEQDALRALAAAGRLARELADLPGASAWLAEVEVATGIAASQAGLDALAVGALSRAATLDATRGVRAAEAPPEIVARAEAIARAVATRPEGRFTVHASIPGAQLFLDDVSLGEAPRSIRTPVGAHVLRVEGPAHLSYGAVIDVVEGEGPDIHVALAPSPAMAVLDRLAEAARRRDARAVLAHLRAAVRQGAPFDAVWVVDVPTSPRAGRALAVRCHVEEGCAINRLVRARHAPGAPPRTEPLVGSWRPALGWLNEASASASSSDDARTTWPLWVGLGVGVMGALAVGIWAAQSDSEPSLRVVIDPSMLGDRGP